MTSSPLRLYRPVPHTAVWFEGHFWGDRLETNRTATIPAVYRKLKAHGQVDALRMDWKPGMPNKPHIFWESDLAKWIEAAAYTLAVDRDPDLEAQVDGLVEALGKVQQSDGYLNVYFTIVEPQARFTNLRDRHELYCAGHLIEAAVAYAQATGKTQFLHIMQRYADLIDRTFGPEPGQKRGYPGHEELELALVKLYRYTGEACYLKLSHFFVDERGAQPHYFDEEAQARGEDPADYWAKTHEYTQAHLPVRQQEDAVGHSVRAAYLYSAMADLAAETGDESLLQALLKLYESATSRRMYITGGLGSAAANEGFTWDYDLPNESAYSETCAAIGLFLWSHRMLQLDLDGRYADVMERCLYNNILASTSLSGDRYFYVNPLEVQRQPPGLMRLKHLASGHRQKWYDCACCPPNIARLFASLGGFFYTTNADELVVHHYAASRVSARVGNVDVNLHQETDYPWSGEIHITLDLKQPVAFTLRLRIPGWCRRAIVLANGEVMPPHVERGYAYCRRLWKPGDTVTLRLDMPVERVYAHPNVAADAGRTALQRGPLVYCLESVDNGPQLNAVRLPRSAALEPALESDLLGGVVTLAGEALRASGSGWAGLYQAYPTAPHKFAIKAVPYYTWDNRAEGDMLVWLVEDES
jgi:uncharacterized protein